MSIVGIGIDLVELDRVRQLLARRRDQAMARFLTEGERAYVSSRTDPVPHMAARLAAKEAVYKALQELPDCRGVGWRDIEVSRDETGKPSVSLSGLAAAAADANGPLRIHLSLTHTHVSAAAVAVIERRGAAR
ncbi:MAG TPA: holo-ACP synthase [Gemmatimonadales bacterium]